MSFLIVRSTVRIQSTIILHTRLRKWRLSLTSLIATTNAFADVISVAEIYRNLKFDLHMHLQDNNTEIYTQPSINMS